MARHQHDQDRQHLLQKVGREAAVLRRATEFKNMGQRREYLRNNGVEA